MTTNSILGGLFAVLSVGNGVAAAWLYWHCVKRIKARRSGSALSYFRSKDSIRISFGFAMTATALAILFALSIPLMVFSVTGYGHAAWLDATIYWQAGCTVMMLVGLLLIMWPAFSKWAPRRLSLAIAFFATVLVFCLGAAGVQLAAGMLK